MRVLWIWLSTIWMLTSASPPPDQNDPYILHLPSSLINDTVRENILKTCDDPLAWTFDSDPVAAWNGLGCYELHGILDYDWYMNRSERGLSYVEYLSSKMRGPSNWKCQEIDNIPCSSPDVQCHDTEFACGFLILNSLANIHAMYARGYNGLLSAHDRFQDDVLGFTDIFAPEVEVFHWLGDLLIPMITLGIGLLGEATERVLKMVTTSLKAMKKAERDKKGKNIPGNDGDELDKELDKKYETMSKKIRDGVMLTAGMSQPYMKLHLPVEATGETTDAKVASLLGQVYDQLMTMQMMQVNHLFNGSSHSMSALYRMINGGTFILFDGNNTLLDYHEEAKKMFIAALIPHAWKVAPGFDEDRQGPELTLYTPPTFLKTGSKCGEKPTQLDSYPHDDDFAEICHEGQQWYIIRVEAKYGGTRGSLEPPKWWFKLRKLPGTDVLASENGYQGVRGTDMLISALSAYEQFGQQFWSPPEGSSVIKEDGSGYALQFPGGLHTPGLVQMQVCTDWEKMQQVFARYNNVNQLSEIEKPEWPCGFIEN